MMNKKTRKLSKFPNEIRAKQQKYYVDTPAIMEQDITTWSKGNEIIKDHICKGLMVSLFFSEMLPIAYLLLT